MEDLEFGLLKVNRIFSCPKMFINLLTPPTLLLSIRTRVFLREEEWSGLEVDISPPSNAESGAKQSLHLYVFRTWTGIR